VRDELLDVEEFSCRAEARVVLADWREDHNTRRLTARWDARPRCVRPECTATSELALAA